MVTYEEVSANMKSLDEAVKEATLAAGRELEQHEVDYLAVKRDSYIRFLVKAEELGEKMDGLLEDVTFTLVDGTVVNREHEWHSFIYHYVKDAIIETFLKEQKEMVMGAFSEALEELAQDN